MGCSGISTTVQTSPGVNLASYRTFAWAPHAPGKPENLGDQAIRSSLQQNLAGRNIVPAAPGQPPDFYVAYQTATHEKTQVYYGGYPYYYGYYPSVSTYTEGTLIVDFIDPRSHQVFWRGTASAVVDHPDNPDPGKIAKAVQKLIDRYPAQLAATERPRM
jgi:Domain of unknown function (DUF4136)